MRCRWVVLAAVLSGSVIAGGSEPLRVCLDFFPNPNHAPLYVALVDRLFETRGLDVELIVPANPSDPLKLAAARSVEMDEPGTAPR